MSDSFIKKGNLFIVSTPIGNLGDITLRALSTLKEVDYIACEDTRITLKILNSFKIKKTLISFHSRSKQKVLERIIELLRCGSSVAYLTDSGTPSVSDPGSELVGYAVKEGIEVVPVPGPSAVHTVLSVSGIGLSSYTFMGFLSSKKGRRKKVLNELKEKRTVYVFFESPHRLLDFLEDARGVFGDVFSIVGKEMTKKFEKFYRGSLEYIIDNIKKDGVKGEYTVVIDTRQWDRKNNITEK